MTNIIPTISAAGLGAYTFQPLPDVTPFSIRVGASYEDILSTIRSWLRDELVPYLTDNSPAATFQAAIDTLTDQVNTALTTQSGIVTTALNAAVQEVVTADIPITAALFESMGVHIAPPPRGPGLDDTAALQPLLEAAQATGGTLTLRAGTYLVNLATLQSFAQPRLVGQGKDRTILQGHSSATPVLRVKGGSGAISGGYLADFTITGATDGGLGVGLQLADCGGVQWERLRINGALGEGVQFLSEGPNAFCEFNAGDVEIAASVVLPVHYTKTGGNESFHGSGLTRGSVINNLATSTSPMVVIDQGCFPYAAPLDVAVFPKASNVPIIRNNNTARYPSFVGNLDIEPQNANSVYVGDPASANEIYLQGGVVGLITGTNLRLGKVALVDKVYYNGGVTSVLRKPYKETVTLAAGTTPLKIVAGTCMVEVDVYAAQYHYAYLLHCWQSPYDPTGVITQLANPKSLNQAGLGAPTFAWNNYVLQITNAAYSSAVIAFVKVVPVENPISGDVLGNY